MNERFFTALWRAMPDLRFELLEGPYLAEDGRHAAARVRVDGDHDGSAVKSWRWRSSVYRPVACEGE